MDTNSDPTATTNLTTLTINCRLPLKNFSIILQFFNFSILQFFNSSILPLVVATFGIAAGAAAATSIPAGVDHCTILILHVHLVVVRLLEDHVLDQRLGDDVLLLDGAVVLLLLTHDHAFGLGLE